MKLHIIGAGCPNATAKRYGSAFVLDVGGDRLMVDCGPAATYKMAQIGITPESIDRLFFTHHHFDHNVDFPCLALTRWDQALGTEPPLTIYGPPPTARFVDAIMGAQGAFHEDVTARVEHPASHMCHQWRGGSLPRPRPVYDVHEIDEGEVAKTDRWTCTAARVHHCEPYLISVAYRFESDEGSIVFAADCGDCPEIRRFAKDADTIVMACTHFGRNERNGAIVDVITGTPEVAGIANEANIGRVVLTHTSPNYLKPGVIERSIGEIARSYAGQIVFPDELVTVNLSK